jgi:hypothetical protein
VPCNNARVRRAWLFVHVCARVPNADPAVSAACCNTRTRQAVARQQEFEKSAVGKATMKAVKAAKQREARPEGPDLAQDWRS